MSGLYTSLVYLLGLGGGEFQLRLKASDYLDFIIIIMLAMGLIFQMPAIAYVLARIGILSAGFMLRTWKVAIVIILIVAAVASPTGDIPNMMLLPLRCSSFTPSRFLLHGSSARNENPTLRFNCHGPEPILRRC